jgi:hypothetical protein
VCEDVLARLRLEVDLEHARHTVTHLKYALRDTRFLVTTLWDIIAALREIISGHYADQTRLVHGAGAPAHLARIQNETERALGYKRAAQEEADRAIARLRTLEERWERAQAELHRLSLMPDAMQIVIGDSTSPEGDAPSLPPWEWLSQPALDALDDIKAALDKARVINVEEDAKARGFQDTAGDTGGYSREDERRVLLAATRLSEADSRRTALASLLAGWPDHPDTRDTLLRLADDPEVRVIVAGGLAAFWGDDSAARGTLVSFAQDSSVDVRVATVTGVVALGWRDEGVLELLLSLARDPHPLARTAAAEGLTVGWSRSDAAYTALLEFVLNPDEDAVVRQRAVNGLLKHWHHVPHTRDSLLQLACGGLECESEVSVTALAGIIAHWFDVPQVRAAVLRLDPHEYAFRMALDLVVERWRGHRVALRALIGMSETDDTAVLQALSAESATPMVSQDARWDAAQRATWFRAGAVRRLQAGWAGDAVARDAVLRRTYDPDPYVRAGAGEALVSGWSGDEAAQDAISRLAQDDNEHVQMSVTLRSRRVEQGDAPPAP